jgi:hypothetical protein
MLLGTGSIGPRRMGSGAPAMVRAPFDKRVIRVSSTFTVCLEMESHRDNFGESLEIKSAVESRLWPSF